MEWTVKLMPPEFATGPKPAKEAWGAVTDDSRPLEVFVYGDGSGTSPRSLYVRLGLRSDPHEYMEREEDARLRNPTFEELQEAANRFYKKGALISLGAIVSMGADAPPPDLEDLEFLGVQLDQIGAAEGSPAAHGLIVTPGGLGHAN